MDKVHIRKAAENPPNGSESRAKPELTPLRVSGVVVDKAALIEALRVYVPALADIRVTEDGDHFWLMLEAADAPIPSPSAQGEGESLPRRRPGVRIHPAWQPNNGQPALQLFVVRRQ